MCLLVLPCTLLYFGTMTISMIKIANYLKLQAIVVSFGHQQLLNRRTYYLPSFTISVFVPLVRSNSIAYCTPHECIVVPGQDNIMSISIHCMHHLQTSNCNLPSCPPQMQFNANHRIQLNRIEMYSESFCSTAFHWQPFRTGFVWFCSSTRFSRLVQ